MAQFIFVPSDVEHPTEAERYFLVRHFGHDLQNDDFSMVNLSDTLLSNKCDDLLRAHRKIYYFSCNISKVHFALTDLNKNLHSEKWLRLGIFKRLAGYLREAYPEMDWHLDINLNEAANIKNWSAVWLQLLNFSQNAARHGEQADPPLAILSLDQLALSPKELAYLGRNQHQYTPRDRFIKASVQDFGQGIAPERLPHVIPRTEELKIDPRRRAGLSLTDYVCDYLHGFVKVESELGKGSTFSLYFPQEYKPRRVPKQLELPFRSLSGPNQK